jgi:hypothetical protein
METRAVPAVGSGERLKYVQRAHNTQTTRSFSHPSPQLLISVIIYARSVSTVVLLSRLACR